MAQVVLRFFREFELETQLEIADLSKTAVAKVHYDIEADQLKPDDVTLADQALNIRTSSSSAAYELEVSEGSDNWPRDPETGLYLPYGNGKAKGPMELALDERGRRVSAVLSEVFPRLPHNIFEVTGVATGWYMYKPAA